MLNLFASVNLVNVFSGRRLRLPALLVTSLLLMQPVHAGVSASVLQVEPVRKESLLREFRLDGVVEAVNKATVSAQTGGAIQKIYVDVDDYVEKGAVIMQLKDVSQKAQLKKAQAGEKEAIANLAKAQDEYDRVKDVYAKKVVSKSSMDEATHALSAAKARLEAARASLDEAREQLSYTQVKAPYSGIVTQRHVEAGETVQPGTKLMTGVSLDKLRVNVDVPQSLINKVRRHETAYVYIDAVGWDDAAIDDGVSAG